MLLQLLILTLSPWTHYQGNLVKKICRRSRSRRRRVRRRGIILFPLPIILLIILLIHHLHHDNQRGDDDDNDDDDDRDICEDDVTTSLDPEYSSYFYSGSTWIKYWIVMKNHCVVVLVIVVLVIGIRYNTNATRDSDGGVELRGF